jgi:hypothetical protein
MGAQDSPPMLQVTAHEDVTQLRLMTWRSRLSRMRVSACAVRDLRRDAPLA